MEMKWYSIVCAVFFIAIFAGMAYSDFTKSQCRIAYANSAHTPEEIGNICK